MPIVGAPPQFEVITLVSTISANRTAKSYDVSQYSHSTVFTFWSNATKSENAPPLTTLYQPPDVCRGRWMLIDNGAEVVTTLVQTRTAVGTGEGITGPVTLVSTAPGPSPEPSPERSPSSSVPSEPSLSSSVPSEPSPSSSVPSEPSPSSSVPSEPSPSSSVPSEQVGGPFRVVRREEVEAREILTAFRYTAWSIDSDPLFKSCQPYSDMPLYSPGVCPEGQEIVEVTQILANKTDGGVHTSWQGSCCSSGMSFGPNVSRFCQSTITVPLAVHAYITSSGNSSYEWVQTVDGSTSTLSSITGLATGLAVADPVVVAWNLEEMEQFPDAYRTSLARRIGVASPASAASSGTIPEETGNSRIITPTSNGLSTGAKAGIGVGVGLGTVLLLVLLVMYLMRRSAKARKSDIAVAELEDPNTTNAWKRWFLGGRWRNEADVDETTKHELDSRPVNVVSGPPAELASTDVGTHSQIDNGRVVSNGVDGDSRI